MTSHEPYWELFNLDSKVNLVLHRYDFHEPYWELFNLDSKANLVLHRYHFHEHYENC
jgi:hypothetical protein